STTTPGWPMWRCWATSAPRPAPGYGAAPTAGLPCTASRWSGPERQRGRLPQPAVRYGAGLNRRAPPAHQALPAPDNGKVERFNRTLLEEWAYRRPYPSNAARDRALP